MSSPLLYLLRCEQEICCSQQGPSCVVPFISVCFYICQWTPSSFIGRNPANVVCFSSLKSSTDAPNQLHLLLSNCLRGGTGRILLLDAQSFSLLMLRSRMCPQSNPL
eukprot:Blabericola_migrator_1__3016@NODE_1877_length_3615_cov_208_228016_g1202_i0_p3_GENE_NODE_1877_length_3615_cov_208_228016_g1202_i0NODE_1877_length_3615_cov_208_228016_g1202_i0_p3_ORF_typecomplete_len107_score6_89_NODE_1877_length_3615_cov_208_228016_g1202_i08831203